MRQQPVLIEVQKSGQSWSVLVEAQPVALLVHEKGAHTLAAVLRGLLRYTSRKLFRLAVADGLKAPKPVEPAKEGKAKGKPAEPKPKAGKPSAAKKGKVAAPQPALAGEAPVQPASEPASQPVEAQEAPTQA